MAGVALTTDPTVAGVNVSTDASGSYSAELPVGVYALTFKATNYTSQTAPVSLIAGGVATKDVALVPVAPVVVSTSVSGTAAPGNTLTASVSAIPMDGSSVTGTTWAQKSGAPVTLQTAGGTGQPVQVTLPDITTFKDEFFSIIANERNYLLDRYMVMGVTPLDLEEAGRVVLEVTVATTTGTLKKAVTIDAALPFAWSGGIRDVPVGVAVLLHGKNKTAPATYNWTVAAPSGSGVTALQDATTQNPYFTPDVKGKYTVTEGGVSLVVYAGLWAGAIGPDGQPSSLCTVCHDDTVAPDKFTPWKASGHAEIFTQNLNAGGHYGPACFACHTVGYNPNVDNNGIDDQPQYTDFLNTFFPGGHSPSPSPNNWATMLAQFPGVARFANIQCENCHGPNDSDGHKNKTDKTNRVSIASDVCGVCHGEPARHGRFQQWQESGHGNYQLAIDEGTNSSCTRCHSGNGFLLWMDQTAGLTSMAQRILGPTGQPATASELNTLYGINAGTVHPQTCAVCHDPHAQGTTSGEPNTATVRITDETKFLPAGFAAVGVGRGAICITCHNTRNGPHNDAPGNLPSDYPKAQPFTAGSYSAPHSAAQGDVLMGQNAYFVTVGDRSPHSFIVDTCATCHMELTPPPADFSYELAGTNHSFAASLKICSQCHGVFDGGTLQASVEEALDDLATTMAAYLTNAIIASADINGQITINDYTPHTFNGKAYDLKSDDTKIDTSNIASLASTEPHGQQGYIVRFTTPVTFTYTPPSPDTPHQVTVTQAQVQLGDITKTDGTTNVIPTTDPLVRAGWNYFLIHGDNSKGIHNPAFVFDVLNASKAALETPPS